MTLHDLDVAPDDVAARELGYRVDTEPAPDALATDLFEHPHLPVSLRVAILGASHSVTIVVEGEDTVTEEVSCRAAAGHGLPRDSESSRGQWGTHRLRGAVETESAAGFEELVDELTARAERDAGVLAGRFPGPAGALTVVEARADDHGWRWRTWHLYPATVGGDVVTTESTFESAFARVTMEVVA